MAGYTRIHTAEMERATLDQYALEHALIDHLDDLIDGPWEGALASGSARPQVGGDGPCTGSPMHTSATLSAAGRPGSSAAQQQHKKITKKQHES